ncbi:MAG: sugar phosphate isomerase/epimerase [Phycisphaerae bacterium]|nr:sugar phosphate isomerase/epimerase [Phycisphaerae bacterium]
MSDIRLTSSPWGFRQTQLIDQFEWFRKVGLDYVCGQFFAEMPGMLDPGISEFEIVKIRATAGRYGLSYASFNGDGDFMVAKNVEKEIATCIERIDKAVAFGPEVIIVFAGWQDRSDDAVYAQVSAALKQIARHAARYNLTVALENHGGLTTTAQQINRILDGVGEDNIGVNYDPANFLMYGEDPFKALKGLKHPITFTHFKSLKRTDGKKAYCRIREGEIDYVPILKELAKTYRGFYAIEYEEPSDVFAGSEDDLKSLKDLLTKAGVKL